MLRQVEIAPRRDPFQFLRAKGEFVQNVHRGFGVMRQLLLFLPVKVQRIAIQTDALVPFHSLVHPVFVPLLPAPIWLRRGKVGVRRRGAKRSLRHFIRLDEEFQFHLFELAGAEGEIAGIDLVPKRLADLANAERDPLPRNLQHVLELRKDRLRGLGTEVGDILLAFDRANVGFEHQVELARLRKQAAVFRVVARRVRDLTNSLTKQVWIRDAALLVKLPGHLVSA